MKKIQHIISEFANLNIVIFVILLTIKVLFFLWGNLKVFYINNVVNGDFFNLLESMKIALIIGSFDSKKESILYLFNKRISKRVNQKSNFLIGKNEGGIVDFNSSEKFKFENFTDSFNFIYEMRSSKFNIINEINLFELFKASYFSDNLKFYLCFLEEENSLKDISNFANNVIWCNNSEKVLTLFGYFYILSIDMYVSNLWSFKKLKSYKLAISLKEYTNLKSNLDSKSNNLNNIINFKES